VINVSEGEARDKYVVIQQEKHVMGMGELSHPKKAKNSFWVLTFLRSEVAPGRR